MLRDTLRFRLFLFNIPKPEIIQIQKSINQKNGKG